MLPILKKDTDINALRLFGSVVGAFGVGCPTCRAFLFGIIGAPLAFMSFPLRGLELQILGILLLTTSIYFVAKTISSSCEIKK